MKEHKVGIIYIKESDEIKVIDSDTAFDYIPTNANVEHSNLDVPIEIDIKPIRKELMKN